MKPGIRGAIDNAWNRLWSEGVSNPIRSIEVIALALLASRLRAESQFELRHQAEPSFDAAQVLDKLGIDFGEAAGQVRPETYEAIERNLEQFSLLPDAAGDALEYALSHLSSAGRFGQFRTPSHIISMMVSCIPIFEGATVLDPSAGTGGFLTACISEHPNKQMQLIGDEIDPSMAAIANANLALRGRPHSVERRDALDGLGRTADIVFANPPFSGRINPESTSPTEIPSNRTEVLFTDLITKRVQTEGWAAFIVPISVLTNNDRGTVAARRVLHRDGTVRAVVELPSGTFRPYTDVRTAIIFWHKSVSDAPTHFWRIEADGYSLDDRRLPIGQNDVPLVALEVSRLLHGGNSPESANTVPRHHLEAGTSSLLPSRYLSRDAVDTEHDDFDELIAQVEREVQAIASLLGELR